MHDVRGKYSLPDWLTRSSANEVPYVQPNSLDTRPCDGSVVGHHLLYEEEVEPDGDFGIRALEEELTCGMCAGVFIDVRRRSRRSLP